VEKFQMYFEELPKKIFKDNKISNFEELFTIIQSLDLLCELSLSEEDVVYIGKIIDVYEDSIDIDFFDTECKLMDQAYVEYEDITTVTVFSDYLNTLSEVMKSTKTS